MWVKLLRSVGLSCWLASSHFLASSSGRRALLHHQFPKVVVLTVVWLCRKHHCLRHLAFIFSFFPLTCCRNSLSTPFTSQEHLPAWIILLSMAPLACCAQALHLQQLRLSPALKTRKKWRYHPGAEAGRRLAERALPPSCNGVSQQRTTALGIGLGSSGRASAGVTSSNSTLWMWCQPV